MTYFIVFLTSALTALIGPWVDAPLSLSTLSGILAIATAALAVRNGKIEIEVSENPPAVQDDKMDEKMDETGTKNIQQTTDDSETSIRITALEEELSTVRSRNEELSRERIELLRKATRNVKANNTRVGAQTSNTNELQQAVRQRDSWIQAQQISMGELRKQIDDLKQLIKAAAPDSLDAGTVTGTDLQQTRISTAASAADTLSTTVSSLADKIAKTLERAKAITSLVNPVSKSSKPLSLTHLSESLSSIHCRLDEIADKTRVAAMNARLLHERPMDEDSLAAFAEELTDVASIADETARQTSNFSPAIEKVKIDLQRFIDDHDSEIQQTTKMISTIQAELQEANESFVSIQSDLGGATGTLQDTLNALGESIRATENRKFDSQELHARIDALTLALDITLERMVEISKVTTSGSAAPSPESHP